MTGLSCGCDHPDGVTVCPIHDVGKCPRCGEWLHREPFKMKGVGYLDIWCSECDYRKEKPTTTNET